MKYGLFSDVHANVRALEGALGALEAEGVDQLVCLGDTVGYGSMPEVCCTRIRESGAITVLGNHDAAVSGRMDYSYYYAAAREALDRHAKEVSDETMEWLKGLPYRVDVEEHGLTFCHGSPVRLKEFDYVFAVEQARELLLDYENLSFITFVGHSHLTASFMLDGRDAYTLEGDAFELDPEKKYVITVGSVGQPRDHDARACCGVYDTETRRFRFLRLAYDLHETAQEILDAGIADTFAKRLFLGV